MGTLNLLIEKRLKRNFFLISPSLFNNQMNQQLSSKPTSTIIAVSILSWAALSLSGMVGLFDYVMVPTPYIVIAIVERACHFGLCFLVVNYFLKGRASVAFNENEVIINKRGRREIRVPFSQITKLRLMPTYLSISADQSSNFKLYFLGEDGTEDDIDFRANSGKKLNMFLEVIKKDNTSFVFNNVTLN
jgi:hypothetical protein